MSASGEPARLDPFALPSDTDSRFLLLVLTVLGSALFAFNWVYFSLEDRRHEQLVSLRCSLAQGSVSSGLDDTAAYAERARAFQVCIAGIARPKGYWIAAGVGAMILIAVAIYLLTPAWKMRRSRLVPLSPDDAPQVIADLERLSKEAGLAEAPQVVWNALDPATSGLAFGRLGHYRVAVSGGLVVTHSTDPDAFRAVARHELAHLQNRDVDRTYFAMALWYAFLLAAVAPLLVTLPGEGARTILRIAWRLAALILLVYVTRNAVLRARESYADVRVDVTDGNTAIRRVLASVPTPRGRHVPRLLRVHPDPSERIATLDDRQRLFRLGRWEAFGAGIALTLVFHELVTMIGFFDTESLATHWLAALIVAPPVVGVVGVGIWRAALAAAMGGDPLRRSWTLGLALGIGMLVGESLSFDNLAHPEGSDAGAADVIAAISGLPVSRGIISSDVWGFGVLWPLAIVGGMMLFSSWMAAGASLWLRRAGEGGARLAALAGLVAASVVLAVSVAIFYLSYDVSIPVERILGASLMHDAREVGAGWWVGSPRAYRWVTDLQIVYFARRWPVVPTLALVSCFPLAAAVGRRGARGTGLSGVRLRRALAIGAGVGGLVWISALVLRFRIHEGVSLDRRSDPSFGQAFTYWTLLLALGGQVIAAAVAALLAPAYRILHGLFSALVCGVLGAAAFVLGPTAGSCVSSVSIGTGPIACPFFVTGPFARDVFQQVLGEGFVLAFAGAGLATVAAAIGSRDLRDAR
jgi:Zn-dependent protease with chaperone function